MKKFSLKFVAAAAGLVVSSSSFAAVTPVVDFDSATPTVNNYAKELPYSNALPLAHTGGLNFTSKIGFGVSSSQTRYIRVDYVNATLDAAHAGVLGTDIEINDTNGATHSAALVQGGAIGDSYVIYQITAGADLPATAPVDVLVPNLRVTSTASPVQVTYSLHETAVSAVAGAVGAGKLYSKTANVATFGAGLSFALTVNTSTASVEKSFKEFTTAGTNPGVSALLARVGKVTYGVSANTKRADGTQVVMADLVAAGTKLVVTGDFSAVAGANLAANKTNVFLDNNDACGSSTLATTDFVGTFAGASFTLDTNAATKNVCYTVASTAGAGTKTIPAGSYTAGVTVTAAADTATPSITDASLGSIIRDGTELQAPFATIHPDYLSRVVLTSQHTVDATVQASVITEDGVTCPTVNGDYTLKAGKQLIINTSAICPALSNGTRLAVKLVIAAPNNSISGVYNVMNYNQVTGATDSLISYPLLRPGSN